MFVFFISERLHRYLIIGTLFLLSWAFALKADEVPGPQALDTSVVVHLRIAYPLNVSTIEEDYMSNARVLPMVKEYLERSPRIDSIIIYSYASPEGPLRINRRLAAERGRNAREYLLRHLPPEKGVSEDRIKIDPTPENWEGLIEMVKESYPYEDKEELVSILEDRRINDDQREARMRRFNGGRPWEYIRTEILPHLRYAKWTAAWQKIELKKDMPEIAPLPQLTMTACAPAIESPIFREFPEVVQEPEVLEKEKLILALKTNMLYDVVSMLNFSIEVPLFKERMSILYYHQAPWWTWGMADNEFCLRFLSIGTEARVWSAPQMRGHFLGVYGESGKYDFEHKRSICRQGEFWSAGLSYGYAMPVGKRQKLNLEFSVSAGYASIAFRGYVPSEDYEILWRDPSEVGRWHYWGPTKAQISLVIPITVRYKSGR